MKVVLLTFHSFDQVKGGTELFSEHLRRAFPDLRTITYQDVAHSGLPNLERLNLQQPRMGVSLSNHIKERLEEEDPDLIICNSTAGWWLSVRPPHVPMMNVFHFTSVGLAEGTLRGTPGYLPTRYLLPVFEKISTRAKEVIAVSTKVQRELRTHYHSHSTVIENGVDLERFVPMDRMDARRRLGIDHTGPLAIFVGRGDHTKGIDLLCGIAKQRDDLRTLCVTSSDLKGKRLIVRRNVPNEMMPLHYAAADLLLFPSRYESFGYAPLEAMACDVPVVASRTGLFEDFTDERAGVVVPRFEVHDYLEAIDRVLASDHHPREVVGERFSLDRFAREYREAAQRMLDE
ncbi:MAG: glycosyltransferase family 4 protein [Methanomassiliicoccus sp.]|nr:glycosyltransferase family 4 protein [Methanomassiliicoccus sp.]